MASTTIAVVGSLMVDHIVITNRLPERGETYPANKYHKALGGKGANAAIAAYRTCHRKTKINEQGSTDATTDVPNINVRMIGRVGNDEYAAVFKTALTDDGIDASGVLVAEGKATAMTFIMVEEDTRDNRILSVAGAGEALSPADFMAVEDLGSGVQPGLVISQLEIDIKAVEQMLETAGTHGIDFLLNAAPASSILMDKFRYITHLLVNESEAAILSGLDLEEVTEDTWPSIAKGFLNDGAKNVVITLGEHGAYYANKRASGHVPAFKVVAVDPTGAGDTFTGAYASEYIRQTHLGEDWDIKKAVTRACKAAALTVATLGAQEGIPWADEIDDFQTSNEALQVEEEGGSTQENVIVMRGGASVDN